MTFTYLVGWYAWSTWPKTGARIWDLSPSVYTGWKHHCCWGARYPSPLPVFSLLLLRSRLQFFVSWHIFCSQVMHASFCLPANLSVYFKALGNASIRQKIYAISAYVCLHISCTCLQTLFVVIECSKVAYFNHCLKYAVHTTS